MISLQESYRSGIVEKIAKANPGYRRTLIEKAANIKPKNKDEKKETRKFLSYDRKGKWSKERILEILREVAEEYGKLTCTTLRELRDINPEKYPAVTTVKTRFNGSWKDVCRAVGGKACPVYFNSMGDSIDLDIYYFLDLFHRFGIKTKILYREARKKYPEIVPPYTNLTDLFGSFLAFRRIANIDSCSGQIKRLVQLVEDLEGRWPKRAMCKERDIDIVFLDKKLGSRRELRAFVKDIRARNYKVKKGI